MGGGEGRGCSWVFVPEAAARKNATNSTIGGSRADGARRTALSEERSRVHVVGGVRPAGAAGPLEATENKAFEERVARTAGGLRRRKGPSPYSAVIHHHSSFKKQARDPRPLRARRSVRSKHAQRVKRGLLVERNFGTESTQLFA